MGNMIIIMPIAAKDTLPVCFSRKKAGTPTSAPAPKQRSCRFVRLKNTLGFTRVRSRGTEIYAANLNPSLFQRAENTPLARSPVLNSVKHSNTV